MKDVTLTTHPTHGPEREKQTAMNKCYACKHRRDVPGSVHSQCAHPIPAQHGGRAGALSIVGEKHGADNGWFTWPWNFDPVWLIRCDGFEAGKPTATEPPQAEIDREERDTIPAPSPELDGAVRLMNMALWFAQGGRF